MVISFVGLVTEPKMRESQLFLADWNHRSARRALLNSTKEPSYSYQPNITESDLKSQVKFLAATI